MTCTWQVSQTITVDFGLVLDAFGAVGEEESAHCLGEVVAGRPDSGHHHGLGIATQRVLQQVEHE